MPPTRIGIDCWQFGLPCFPLDQRSTKVCISPLAVRDDQQGWPIFPYVAQVFTGWYGWYGDFNRKKKKNIFNSRRD